MVKNLRVSLLAFVLALGVACSCRCFAGLADELVIPEPVAAKGGLAVHVGASSPELVLRLAGDKRFVVQVLVTKPELLARMRQALLEAGLYGRVSVDLMRGNRLPYADNLVDLLVVDEPECVHEAELRRVLVPNGYALIRTGDGYRKFMKPWPEGMDDWPQFQHGPDGNPVARDRMVSPPRRLRWRAGPLWSRSHEYRSSLCTMVTAGGRLFYIFDEGLTSITTDEIPDRWTLVARNAFNGILLWKRPLPNWGKSFWRSTALRGVPSSLQRSLACDGLRVYVIPGTGEPAIALDADTGRKLLEYPHTNGARELLLNGDQLIVLMDDRLLVFNAENGTLVRQVSGRFQPSALVVEADRLYGRRGSQLVCVDLVSDNQIWQQPWKSNIVQLSLHDGHLLVLERNRLCCFSSKDGEKLWEAALLGSRAEVFAINGKVWRWQGTRLVAHRIEDGKIVADVDPSDVFTPGHHFRCYNSRATVRFIITPNRGAEFVSVLGEENYQHDWMRGACRYGVLPANGLLYVTPHPCFCNPGVMLRGFNALAGASEDRDWLVLQENDRLEKGPAAEFAASVKATAADSEQWPTFRHDHRRSGASGTEVSLKPHIDWKVSLPGPITQPTVCDGKVFVAATDQHTVYAFSLETGQKLWHFTAGGRVDSPPTVWSSLVLFGCRDGWVYCLRADDGQLAWRFRAAPCEERIVAFDQLESPWPVHGSVLVVNDVAYVAAGRSTFLDGGVWLFGLDPRTGRVLYERHLDTWSRTRTDWQDKPFVPAYHIEGARSDILVSEGGMIYLGQYQFNLKLEPVDAPYLLIKPDKEAELLDFTKHPYAADEVEELIDYEKRQRDWLERTQPSLLAELRRRFGAFDVGCRIMGRHIATTSGFLDDSWFNRSYWMYAALWPGYYHAQAAPKTGQLLVVGPELTYAMQAYHTRNFQSPLFFPGKEGYALFADHNDNDPSLDAQTIQTTKGWGYGRRKPPVWFRFVKVRVRGMTLAGDKLYVIGPPDVVPEDDPLAAFEGRLGSILLVLDAATGEVLSQQQLDVMPRFDGLIAAAGKLLLATVDGQLVVLQ